jgi:pimeloyl-ACP methyl ester carboxylesterase
LLHGFPEIAYSWRRIMPPLAAAGFHVVAPDLRGYGRTSGWNADYDADLHPFGIFAGPRSDRLGRGAAGTAADGIARHHRPAGADGDDVSGARCLLCRSS